MAQGDDGTTGTLTKAGTIAAFLVLGGLAVFAVFMVTAVGKSETEWTRLAWVFTGIETLAFAGAGALFGTTVQRARVEDAEKKAKQHEKDAENGRTLAKLVKADSPHTATGSSALEAMGIGTGSPGSQVAARHAAFAEELFPS